MDKDLRSTLATQGYLVLAGLIDPDLLNNLRQTLLEVFRKHPAVPFRGGLAIPNAAVEIPETARVIAAPEILRACKEIFGHERFSFTSHCDLHEGPLSVWHKDDGTSGGRVGYFEESPYGNDDCRVYKVAVYLQEHCRDRSGLSVIPGSHRWSGIDKGRRLYLPTRLGDVVLFDVRLSHAGQICPFPSRVPTAIYSTLTSISQTLKTRIDTAIKKLTDSLYEPRMGVFFSFGLDNEFTWRFAVNNMKRQLRANGNSNTRLPESLRQTLLNHGIRTYDEEFARCEMLHLGVGDS
jgi:hypothetical protein